MTSVVLDSENGDIFIDEQTSLRVTVNTIFPDGTPRDITEAEIVWVASLNGEQKMRKDTDTMQIMLAPQTATVITENASAGDTVINVAKTPTSAATPGGDPSRTSRLATMWYWQTPSVHRHSTSKRLSPTLPI